MTTTPKFDPTKPVQTRDGQPARIICDDVDHPYFTIVAVHGIPEMADTYTANGMILNNGGESPQDLVNIPKSRWINVFGFDSYGPCDMTRVFTTREDADYSSGGTRTGILEIPENGAPVLHDLRPPTPGVAVQIDEGWIEAAGRMPSDLRTDDLVEVRFSNGMESQKSIAGMWSWSWAEGDKATHGMEIVAYRKVP